jgi:hypothetical protein
LDKNVHVPEEAAEIELEDDDSDDDSEPIADSEETLQRQNGSKVVFAVDSQIDLNSRALLDMISDEAASEKWEFPFDVLLLLFQLSKAAKGN